MRQQIEAVSVTEKSRNGAVRATVAASGALIDLVLTNRVHQMAPAEIASQVTACVQRAQARIADRVQQVVQDLVPGEDPAGRAVVASFRDRFPEPPPPLPDSGPTQMRFGPPHDDDPPAVRPAAVPRRPRPRADDEDDGDFAGPILR